MKNRYRLVVFFILVFIFSLVISCDLFFTTVGSVSSTESVSTKPKSNPLGNFNHNDTEHWLINDDTVFVLREPHIYYKSYEIDGTSGNFIQECSICHYKKYIPSASSLPEYSSAKDMYTLTVYAPANVDYSTDKNESSSFTLYATQTTLSINDVSTNRGTDTVKLENYIVARGSDEWYLKGSYSDVEANNPLKYWFTNEKEKVKFYISDEIKGSNFGYKNLLNSSSEEAVTFWESFKTKINTELNKSYLSSERNIFNLNTYDYDRDGYFRIVIVDFGESEVKVASNGVQNSVSGTAGVYINHNLTDESDSNRSDMFYVNARFIMACYYKLNYNVDKCVEACMTTLSHEYMHFLQGAYWLNKNKHLSGSMFLIEGVANAASYLALNDYETFNSEGHMKVFLPQMRYYYPSLSEYNEPSGTPSNCSYAMGPLYFIYIKEKYGQEYLNEYIKQTSGNMETSTKNVLNNNSFMYIYTDCLRTIFPEANNSSSSYYKLGLKKTELDNAIKNDDKGVSYVVPTSQNVFSAENIHQLSFIVNKWQGKPNKLKLNGNGFRSFVFFL